MYRIIISALLCFASTLASASALTNNTKAIASESLMPIGAYYYPEQWDESQWSRDLKAMAEAGFEFTHFAEFAWSSLEPRDGVFDFSWLDRCVKLAADNGLKVIMCTPSPTPPAWLTQKHPEILVKTSEGHSIKHGMRLNCNPSNPVYQKYIRRIVEKMAERYGDNPVVVGWQIDNEPHFEGLYDYSDFACKDFRRWLREKYGSINLLNKAWGAAFWSLTYNDFNQIDAPNPANHYGNPHAFIDFKRFNADAIASGLRFQEQVLRENIEPRQWITTNHAYYKFLPSVDPMRTRECFDFASHTMYPMNTFLDYAPGLQTYRLGSGMEMSFMAEMTRSVTGRTAIMELQPGQINWGTWNSMPMPGAVRMWIWHCFGLGDEFVCTYRFRQPLYGSEQFHKGIMEPDGVTLSPGGREFVRTIKEIASLPKVTQQVSNVNTPDNNGIQSLSINEGNALPADMNARSTAFLWKHDNLFAMEHTQLRADWDPWKFFYTYYTKLKSMGCPVTFIEETDSFDPATHPFMVVPAFEMMDSTLIAKLHDYAEAGGQLIITFRSGLKDNNSHLWESLQQQPLWSLIGSRIEGFDQLPATDEAHVEFNGASYAWNQWGDLLAPEPETEIWAAYTDQFYAGTPCVTSRTHGKGRVCYIGVQSSDMQLEEDILRRIYDNAGVEVLNLPDYVFVEYRDGYYVGVNYSSDSVELPIGDDAEILIGQKILRPGQVTVWRNVDRQSMMPVADIARPDEKWELDFQNRISQMWGSRIPRYKVAPLDPTPDCGKRYWSALLAKLQFAKEHNPADLPKLISKGREMLEGIYTGSFYKPFSAAGYAMYFFNWRDEIEKYDPSQLQLVNERVNSMWHYLLRADHLMDACCGYNDKGGKEFNSENFQWMLKSAGYLFAHGQHRTVLRGDTIDMSAKDVPGIEVRSEEVLPQLKIVDAKSVDVIGYFDESLKNLTRALFNAGRVEWNSNNYFGHTLNPLHTIYQCAEKCGDPNGTLNKKRAQACLDWMMTEAALHYRDGLQVAADSRAKVSAFLPFRGSCYGYTIPYFADSIHYPSFGEKVWLDRDPGCPEVGFLLNSDYRPAQVIIDIANKNFDVPVEIQSAKPFYHIDKGQLLNPDGTVCGQAAYSSWNGEGDGRRFEFETIYIGNNFTMASAAIGRPDGRIGTYSELANWRIGVDGTDSGARMLVGNAGVMNTTNGRDSWHQIGQYRNMMMQLINSPENNRIWIAVPSSLFVDGSKHFLEYGSSYFFDMGFGVYVALIPSEGVKTTVKHDFKESADHSIVNFQWPIGALGTLVTEVGDKDSYGSFKDFVDAVSKKSVSVSGNFTSYTSPRGNNIKMEFTYPASFAMVENTFDTPAVNPVPNAVNYPRVWGDGSYIDFESWDSYQTVFGFPVVNQTWGSGTLTLRSRERSAKITVDPVSAEVTYYESH